MQAIGRFDFYSITGLYGPAFHCDAHNACFANNPLSCVEREMFEQAWFEILNLPAWVAKTRNTQDNLRANTKQCVASKIEQFDAARRNVFAKIAGAQRKTLLCKLIKQFAMDQMHLPQIVRLRIGAHAAQMLDCSTCMGIAVHPMACNYADFASGWLGESMRSVAVHCDNIPAQRGGA